MRLTKEEYDELMSRPAIKARNQAPSAESQSLVQHEPLGAPEGKASHATRYALSVTSYRVRLTDPDNLCPKYFVDSLRYAGLIPDDTCRDIELSIRQVRVKTKAEQRTEIELIPL